MRHYFPIIFVCALAFTRPVFAGADAVAELAGRIFFSVCINSKGEDAAGWAGDYKLVPLPAERAALFLKGEGQAWFSLFNPGNMVLTVHKSGLCSVHVRRVDSDAMTKEVAWVVNYVGRGKKIEELEPSTSTHPYGKSLTRSFRLSEVNGTNEKTVVFTASAAPNAPLQALLSIANAP